MSYAMPQVMTSEAAKADDPAAFRRLAEAYYAPVFQFLARQVPDRADAEDLTQLTFIEAYRSFGRFDPGRPFAPWIYTIARRCLADFYRKRGFPNEDLSEGMADPEPDPREAASRSESADRLWAAARRLKPKYHQVLLLHYHEQFSLGETAGILGLSVPHVKVLLFRARKLLKKRLEPFEPTGEPTS